jgi:hypothetical protein
MFLRLSKRMPLLLLFAGCLKVSMCNHFGFRLVDAFDFPYVDFRERFCGDGLVNQASEMQYSHPYRYWPSLRMQGKLELWRVGGLDA